MRNDEFTNLILSVTIIILFYVSNWYYQWYNINIIFHIELCIVLLYINLSIGLSNISIISNVYYV